MWDGQDSVSYRINTALDMGQISDDGLAKEIEKYASNPEYKTFLEIGTWNGRGSTRAFWKGFSGRKDDYIFYSLECNREKSADAAKLYDLE
jgi:hypothetical protein